MPWKDTTILARILHPRGMFHWEPVFVLELGDGHLLISGKSLEIS